MSTNTETCAAPDFAKFYEDLKRRPTYVILGVQGSGTNLLAKLLTRIFDFSVIRDRSLIVESGARLSDSPSTREVQRELRIVLRSLFPNPIRRRLLARAYYHQGREYLGIRSQVDRVEIATPEDLAQFFYCYHAFAAGKAQKGVKSDDIWQHLAELDRVIPNRRYIHLVRDPRDNALSIVNKGWGPCHVYTASRFVRDQLSIYLDEVARDPDRSMTVKYETLLNSPAEFLGEFAAFSGLAPCSDYEKQLESLNIRSTNCNKWKRLPTELLRMCETVLSREIVGCGYALATDADLRMSRARRLQITCVDARKRAANRLRRLWSRRVLGR